jgi:hypothetical protein
VDELIARYEWRRRFPELRETIDWVQDLRRQQFPEGSKT